MNTFEIIGLCMLLIMYVFPAIFILAHEWKRTDNHVHLYLAATCPFLNLFLTIGFIKITIDRKMSNLKYKKNARK